MPRFVVLLTQLLDWDEISSCIRTIEEERNVWMIKPFLQKPHANMSKKKIAMEMGLSTVCSLCPVSLELIDCLQELQYQIHSQVIMRVFAGYWLSSRRISKNIYS